MPLQRQSPFSHRGFVALTALQDALVVHMHVAF
jgi:hypothetical protein